MSAINIAFSALYRERCIPGNTITAISETYLRPYERSSELDMTADFLLCQLSRTTDLMNSLWEEQRKDLGRQAEYQK
jgi:hypothetical protein